MNKNNYHPTISVKEGDRIGNYFDSRVTDNFSGFWVYLGIGTIITGFIIIPLLKAPKNQFSMINYSGSSFYSFLAKENVIVDEPEPQELTAVLVSKSPPMNPIKSLRKQSSVAFDELELLSAKSFFSKKFLKKIEEENKQ